MVDYKKMYTLLSDAASDSLDILSSHADEESINWVRFLLQQALIRAEHIYTITASGLYGVEEEHEKTFNDILFEKDLHISNITIIIL